MSQHVKSVDENDSSAPSPSPKVNLGEGTTDKAGCQPPTNGRRAGVLPEESRQVFSGPALSSLFPFAFSPHSTTLLSTFHSRLGPSCPSHICAGPELWVPFNGALALGLAPATPKPLPNPQRLAGSHGTCESVTKDSTRRLILGPAFVQPKQLGSLLPGSSSGSRRPRLTP